ncbi:TPA: hypothetical protein ACHWWO_004084 [Escherichia coli]
MTENIRTDRALRDAKNKLRELEKELKRKDKALAEAAAPGILETKLSEKEVNRMTKNTRFSLKSVNGQFVLF